MLSSWTFLLLKLPEVTSYWESVKRFSQYDVTSINFNSKKVREDEIFVGQDILQMFSGVSKDYKYVKFPHPI